MQALISSNSATSALTAEAIGLLGELIAIPSFSTEEQRTAEKLSLFLSQKQITVSRKMNNLWARNRHFDPALPTILLNSHHDTVRPNSGYTRDPFYAEVVDGRLYGLGANDAGGSLVSLLATFLHFYERADLKYNLIYCASAEEEISGRNGISSVSEELGSIDFAIVGEPTQMQLAVAEKGLLVLDCMSYGVAGHAARSEGDNAIYKAMQDIHWFSTYRFPRVSQTLGPIKMSVTMIQAGTQHNMIPAQCAFTVDIRTTDAYTHEEIIRIVREHVRCNLRPRSTRLKPSAIDMSHPVVGAAKQLGLETYGSPTLSDLALMSWPSVKIGPGDATRSHTADEFIRVEEIEKGIDIYIKLLSQLILS